MSDDFIAVALRSFAAAVLIVAVISICQSAPCLADEQNLGQASAARLPGADAELSTSAEAGSGSQARHGEDCDSAASDNDSSDADHAADAHANQDDAQGDTDKPAPQAAADAAEQGDSSGCQGDSDADGADAQDEPAHEDRTTMQTKVDLYRDSQGYRTATVTTNMNFTLGNFYLGLMRDTILARDSAGLERAEDTTVSFFTELNEQFSVGGGFGSVYSQGRNLPIGSLKTAIDLDHATLEAGISHDLLATTAATIRNRVMQTDASMSLSYEFTRNFVPTLEIHHVNYTDRNSSISVEFAPEYTFHFDGSQLQVGYHFNYQSFATNPNTGYWAPQRLIANKLAAAWIFDRVDYFGRLEGSMGPESAHQIDSQGNAPQGGFSTSAGAAFGIRPARDFEMQCNFMIDRAPGWNSTQLGLQLTYTF
jgi:hypothetical protein